MEVFNLDCTTSTNDDVRRLLSEGLCEVLVIAKNQTAARGRRGRSFVCKDGAGLYASLGFVNHCTPFLIPEFSCVAGVATAEALSEWGISISLKWPNDLMLGVKKLGGILCEYVPEVRGVIIGIGINLDLREEDFRGPGGSQTEDLRGLATSVALQGLKLPDSDNLAKEIASLILKYAKNYPEGKQAVLDKYKGYCNAIGKKLTFYSKVADADVKPFKGTVTDICDDFSLKVLGEDGREQRIAFGELSYR